MGEKDHKPIGHSLLTSFSYAGVVKSRISWNQRGETPFNTEPSVIHIRHGLMAINWLISCRKVSPTGILVKLVTCVVLGRGNSKFLNLIKSGSFDSPSFLAPSLTSGALIAIPIYY